MSASLYRLKGRHRRWGGALAVATVLSVLFLVVYGACNAISSRRSNVFTCYFSWERLIPLVPAMIVPYLSLDLFFFAAPFLCGNRIELRAHARRVVLAILVAGACFLLFPLTLGFTQEEVPGAMGLLFRGLRSLDRPYNLAPSLHIALMSLLWVIYCKHTRGFLRGSIRGWFLLVGASTLLTHQVQIVDVATGLALAAFCFAVVPDGNPRVESQRNPRLAVPYGGGGLLMLAIAWRLRAWGGVALLWPVFTLLTVGLAYAGLGPAVFRKAHGRLPLSSRIFLGPYLLIAPAVSWWISRKRAPYHQVLPRLIIGRRLTDHEAQKLVRGGVRAVLDLTAEYNEAASFLATEYRGVPILDVAPPTLRQLRAAIAFIDANVAKGAVYVHCALGQSRCSCVTAAYLLHTGACDTAGEALAFVRAARPYALASKKWLPLLDRFAAEPARYGKAAGGGLARRPANSPSVGTLASETAQ